jgi:hypothetical protein
VRNMLLSFLFLGHFPEEYPINIMSIVSVILIVGCVVIFFEL